MCACPRILISAPAPDDPGANYIGALSAAGADSRSLYCPAPDTTFDGLLLAGGGDLDPALYAQENQGSHPADHRRDRAELALVSAYLAAGKPILGICRGCQVLNVARGGTLIQDLGPLNATHITEQGDVLHTIITTPGSVLFRLFGPQFCAPSAHHQAVDRAGRQAFVTARDEFGVPEAIEFPGFPVLGLQFHPERMTGPFLSPDCPDGSIVFNWFIRQCRP